MTIYVFDLDGTLTPPRLPMQEDFTAKFLPWLQQHTAFIATGSNLSKVAEQMPAQVLNAFGGVYCSMGNEFWRGGSYVYQNKFIPDARLLALLESFRRNTAYPYTLYPNYIEIRTGMLNFSVLGRDCPYEERLRYQKWDTAHKERLQIKEKLETEFPQYEFSVGGSISIDINPCGCSKAQIAGRLRQNFPDEKIVFFGDRTMPGGNDYELAEALRCLPNTKIVQVDGPAEVLTALHLDKKDD
ncbi:MAG: HAD-IIB family hydrolase [Pseudomonadota bacterium]|nr:HAD-IIB family hydrolase [Pseudomonadota bacterium]